MTPEQEAPALIVAGAAFAIGLVVLVPLVVSLTRTAQKGKGK